MRIQEVLVVGVQILDIFSLVYLALDFLCVLFPLSHHILQRKEWVNTNNLSEPPSDR